MGLAPGCSPGSTGRESAPAHTGKPRRKTMNGRRTATNAAEPLLLYLGLLTSKWKPASFTWGAQGLLIARGAFLLQGRRAQSAGPARPRFRSRSLSEHGGLLPHDLRPRTPLTQRPTTRSQGVQAVETGPHARRPRTQPCHGQTRRQAYMLCSQPWHGAQRHSRAHTHEPLP
jgi:hypothetical protein